MFTILFFLIILITNCISVYSAYTYFAKDIIYTKKDGSKIDVENAINELYSQKTKEISNITPLKYPIFTTLGMKNVKNSYSDGTFSYELNLDYDCTASDALDKSAYDNNPLTSLPSNSSKKVFIFGDNIDIYNVCIKTSCSSGKIINSNDTGSYIELPNDVKKIDNGDYHITYYGKNYYGWSGQTVAVVQSISEIYYNSYIN